jgi:hypothetical protein
MLKVIYNPGSWKGAEKKQSIVETMLKCSFIVFAMMVEKGFSPSIQS